MKLSQFRNIKELSNELDIDFRGGFMGIGGKRLKNSSYLYLI